MAFMRTPDNWNRYDKSMEALDKHWDRHFRDSPLYTPDLLRYVYDYTLYDEDEGAHPTLIEAAATGNLQLIKWYVSVGADVHAGDEEDDVEEEAALFAALQNGQLDVVKYLVEEHKADIRVDQEDGYWIIESASRGGNVDVLKYLVSQGLTVANNTEALGAACESEKSQSKVLKVVKYLVSQSNFTAKDLTVAFRIAVQAGQIETAEYLLSVGAVASLRDLRAILAQVHHNGAPWSNIDFILDALLARGISREQILHEDQLFWVDDIDNYVAEYLSQKKEEEKES
jgi:ankyrin repeat protein